MEVLNKQLPDQITCHESATAMSEKYGFAHQNCFGKYKEKDYESITWLLLNDENNLLF